MKKTVGLILLLAITQMVCAQKATRLWQTSGMSFPHGFHTYKADGKLFFNAYHPANGFQLFELQGEKLKQVTSFKQELGKKDKPEGLQGAQTSNYAWYENNLFFFAAGKGMIRGIYRYDGNFVSLVIEAERMSNNFVKREKRLVTQIGQKSADTLKFFQISINPTHQVLKMDITNNGLCTELGQYGENLYGSYLGGLVRVKTSNNEVRMVPANYFNEQPLNVSNLTETGDYLWFFTYHDSEARLMTIGKYGGNFMEFPECHLGDKFQWVDGFGYLMTYYPNKTEMVKILAENKKKTILELPSLTRVDEIRETQGQLVTTLMNEGNSKLVQISDGNLMEQKTKHIYDPRYVVTKEEELIFLAKEMNTEYLFRADPVIPPMVTDSLYSVFDFWGKGRSVGQVDAKSMNDGGRLRFSILDGNEGDAFDISSTGLMTINNTLQLRKSGLNLYNLKVQVEDREGGASVANIAIKVNYGKAFSRQDLRETLMFFPDFKRAKTLTTTQIKNGESVYVYDFDFKMVDVLIVRNGAIVVGNYPPGMYILNVRNKENLYQKIELQ